MKTSTNQRKASIARLVERGFAIHQQLAALGDEFKTIKELLKDEAAQRPAEHHRSRLSEHPEANWTAFPELDQVLLHRRTAKVA